MGNKEYFFSFGLVDVSIAIIIIIIIIPNECVKKIDII
jgi:hypothetical protein